MDQATTTWALVVGIDRYDDPGLASLDGAVADAVAGVSWLRAIGVPDAQILLHAAPSDASKQPLDALGITYQSAREPDLWQSIHRLTQVTGGTRLFVFLSGHGLYEPTSERLFLTQEAGAAGTYNNLGITPYVKLLLSTGFRRTFLFMDGCQNYPYTETRRQEIQAAIYGGMVPPPARPENGLAACFAASQGQRAAEIAGRGAFLHRLLEAIDPQQPVEDALDLDFETGQLSIDLRRVIADDVRPAVEQACGALSPPVAQTPQLLTYGALGADAACPVLTLPVAETGTISVELSPADALGAIEALELQVQWRPWSLRLPRPRGTTLRVPITARVPVGETAAIRCLTTAGSSWSLERPLFDVSVRGDQPVRFELTSLTPDGEIVPTAAPAEEPTAHIGVKTLTLGGAPAPVLQAAQYARLGASLGTDIGHGTPVEVAAGVQLYPHEDGPELEIAPGARAEGGRVAATIAEVLRTVADENVVIATVTELVDPPSAQIEIEFGPGGARALTGPLADHVPLVVERPGDETAWEPAMEVELARLAAEPVLRVPPGALRLRLDLPWGSWRLLVRAQVATATTVRLPTRVGVPSLRVRLDAVDWPAGYGILGMTGPAPAASSVRPGALAAQGFALTPRVRMDSGWTLEPSVDLDQEPNRGGWMAVLGSEPATVFPLNPSYPLAVEELGMAARVEPLTRAPLFEWDLLMATGRIEDIKPDRLTRLVESAATDELLGLVAAHALHARRQWGPLGEVLAELRRKAWLGLDVDLLQESWARQAGAQADRSFDERLVERAGRGEVPLLRWGVALARKLAPSDDARLRDWLALLTRIDATLSPRSVWAVWNE